MDAIPQGLVETPVSMSPAPARPVLWWAALGAVAVVAGAAAMARWLDGNFRPAAVLGPVPADQSPGLIAAQAIAVTIGVAMFVGVVVWPLFRRRRLSWDGVFLIACGTIVLQDPINDYFNLNFAYNSYLFNRSSWAAYLPGWHTQGLTGFAEPLLLIVPLCFSSFFIMSVVGCWFLRRCAVWLPRLSPISHAAILWVLLCIQVYTFEVGLVRMGLFSFFGAYAPLTLHAGSPFQFPAYEATGVATFDLGLALIRFSRDAAGLSVVERGLNLVRLPGAMKRVLSFLALVAVVQVIGFFGFFVPYNWFSMKANSFPKVAPEFTVGLCGVGTAYACPSLTDPFPREGEAAKARQ